VAFSFSLGFSRIRFLIPVQQSQHFDPLSTFSCLFQNQYSFCFFIIFSYEITTTTSNEVGTEKKNLYKELSLALIASTLLGFGSIFLLLWTGVYI
jgi:hypothetical protein